MNSDTYMIGATIVGFIAFACIWIYAMISWGLLFGLLFGWLPAMIGGAIIGFLWPLVVLLIFIIIANLPKH